MRRKPITVAIVDDDQSLRDSFQDLFESVGIVGRTYASAEEYLETTGGVVFTCVLADVKMSGMSGLALLKELSSRDRSLPVFIMTAFSDPNTEAAAFRGGAAGFFRKPVNAKAVLDAVHRIASGA
jgi:FixJ family two-component response regulator